MERNWLIRTSQNQILGPVAKPKLLEFVQKGALGLTDEVCSGNGYWFALKEKDLVDKYIYGDIPQGYNPITESKSVLARRDNPDRTSSINTAPANKTQVFKNSTTPGVTPKNEDLEFPDITVVRKMPLNLNAEADTKLPDSSDLEFPDVAKITQVVNETFKAQKATDDSQSDSSTYGTIAIPTTNMDPKIALKENVDSGEAVLFPEDDDLAFPDLSNDKTSPKVEKGRVDLSHQYTRTVALDVGQVTTALPSGTKSPHDSTGDDLKFSVDLDDIPEVTEEKVAEAVKEAETAKTAKKERNREDKKLLHDRKVKVSAKSNPKEMRDPTREIVHAVAAETAGPLKKRNDNYLFFILIILILIIVAVFFYFKEILNKPLPV